MFFAHSKTNFIFSIAINLLSANAFNLEQSKILLFGKELSQIYFNIYTSFQFGPVHNFVTGTVNCLQNDKILDWSKLKAFADDKINFLEKLKFVLKKVDNIVGN